MIKKTCFSVLFLLLLSSCSLVPEPLEVENETALIPYQAANNYIGSMARWGGQIVNVNVEDEYTVLEVVQMSLNTTARPQNKNESAGRFKVYFKGLLDPVIYKKGKNVTALGTIGEPVEGNIGELVYNYPKLIVENVYLWDNPKSARWAVGYNPYYGGYVGRGYYGRGYYGGSYYGGYNRSRFYNYSRGTRFRSSRNSGRSSGRSSRH